MPLHLPGSTTLKLLVGSVNGLICFTLGRNTLTRVKSFILFNPSIGRYLSIPPPVEPPPMLLLEPFPRPPSIITALGFDETTNDYKILYIVFTDCFIYSLNSNCWRKLNNTPPVLINNPGWFCFNRSVVFLNGRGIHWLHSVNVFRNYRSCFKFIMVFNVKDETFQRISLPECLANSKLEVYDRVNYDFTMIEFGESLAVIRSRRPTFEDYAAEIWVMKEYGLVESWVKLATLPSIAGCTYSQVLGFRNKDQLLSLFVNFGIVLHNIHNQQLVQNLRMGKTSRFSRLFKYVPSLVLLDKENNVDALTPLPMNDEIARRHKVEQEQEREEGRQFFRAICPGFNFNFK